VLPAAKCPLMVEAFEGNKAEIKTLLPVLKTFMTAHQLVEVTVVADAGMFSKPTSTPSKTPSCRSSSAPGFPRSLTRWSNGAATTRTSRSPMGTS
jgi:hypothetical protein